MSRHAIDWRRRGALSGEPLRFNYRRPERIACCSCGLVHVLVFEEDDEGVFVRFYRDAFETARCRRERKRRKK